VPADATVAPISTAGGGASSDAFDDDERPIPAQILQPPRGRRRSPSRAAEEATLKGPPPRRKNGLYFVGAAALLGMAIGLVVYIASGGLSGDDKPAEAAAPVIPEERIEPAPVPPAPPPTDRVEVVVTPEVKKAPPTKTTIEKGPGPKDGSHQLKATPPVGPKHPPLPPEKPCDPKDHAHGCPKP
jgi:hypothetical protein